MTPDEFKEWSRKNVKIKWLSCPLCSREFLRLNIYGHCGSKDCFGGKADNKIVKEERITTEGPEANLELPMPEERND